MATMANWNGHTFEVGSKLIRAFDELKIKGACETTDKNSDKQKYVERKYGEIPEVSMTVHLNALTGVSNVYAEAMQFVQEATDGATAYFYLGGSKLIPAEMMLVEAQVNEVVQAPARGDTWISCDVALKFKQGTKGDGASGGGGGSGGGSGGKGWLSGIVNNIKQDPEEAAKKVKNYISKAKTESKTETVKVPSLKDVTGGLISGTKVKDTDTQKDTSVKITATTGKASITLSGSVVKSAKEFVQKAVNKKNK